MREHYPISLGEGGGGGGANNAHSGKLRTMPQEQEQRYVRQAPSKIYIIYLKLMPALGIRDASET